MAQRYDTLSDVQLSRWMQLDQLKADSFLCITDSDIYNAYSVLRKAHELIKSTSHKLYVLLPLSVRKHKGFTPWLQCSKTQFRDKSNFRNIPQCCEDISLTHIQNPCILLLQSSASVPPKHVAATKNSLHHASFDFRISGAMERTLVDSGAIPMTTDGHNAVLNFRDHLSKMYRCIATVTTVGAKGSAKLYFKEIFPHYGMPLQIVSDRDTRWNNEFWAESCRLSGVKLS